MAEADCGSCKEFECCLQGGAHFFFKVSPSYVELGLYQKQPAVRIQRFVHLREECDGVRDFMDHPERQNEIDVG